jgi:MFS family permease
MDDEDTPRPSLLTKLKITGVLGVIGGVCGGVAGAILTYLGNAISGYPIPPTLGIYAWNSGIIAAIGATLGPPVAWSMLRTVPLWRALAEPAAAALVASVLAMLFAPSLFVASVPLAAFAAALRLRWEYRDVENPALLSPASARTESSTEAEQELGVPDIAVRLPGEGST